MNSSGTRSRSAWEVIENKAIRCITLEEEFLSQSNNLFESKQIDPDAELQFVFDSVWGPDETTESIYNSMVKDMVASFLNGVNGTVIAYGQTCSGKTYTMTGTRQNPGINLLAIDDVFKYLQSVDELLDDWKLKVSYFEVYNEEIFDLLSKRRRPLRIRESIDSGVFIQDLKEIPVLSREDVNLILKKGEHHRSKAATDYNVESSRSHTILSLALKLRFHDRAAVQAARMQQRDPLESSSTLDADSFERNSVMNLVDLAGSEKASQSQSPSAAARDRLREGGHINRSLYFLCTVISRLAKGSRHVPFRDSRLTRILQPSLGGNSRCLICCTVSPDYSAIQETISTLKFGLLAKTIKNSFSVNESSSRSKLLSSKEFAAAVNDGIERGVQQLRSKMLELEQENEKTLAILQRDQNLEETLGKSQTEVNRLQECIEVLKKQRQEDLRRIKELEGTIEVDAATAERLQILLGVSDFDMKELHDVHSRFLAFVPLQFREFVKEHLDLLSKRLKTALHSKAASDMQMKELKRSFSTVQDYVSTLQKIIEERNQLVFALHQRVESAEAEAASASAEGAQLRLEGHVLSCLAEMKEEQLHSHKHRLSQLMTSSNELASTQREELELLLSRSRDARARESARFAASLARERERSARLEKELKQLQHNFRSTSVSLADTVREAEGLWSSVQEQGRCLLSSQKLNERLLDTVEGFEKELEKSAEAWYESTKEKDQESESQNRTHQLLLRFWAEHSTHAALRLRKYAQKEKVVDIRLASFQKQVSVLIESEESLRSKVLQLQTELEESEGKLEVVTAAFHSNQEEGKQRIESLQEHNSRLETRLEMERSHHKSVQKELREEHRMMEEAEKARAQQESTRAQRAIEKLEKEIRQLDWNRCESEKKSINELQQRDELIASLRQSATNSETESIEATRQLEQSRLETEFLQQKLESEQRQWTERLQTNEKELHKEREHMKRITKDAQDTKLALLSSKRDIETLQSEVARQTSEMKALSEQEKAAQNLLKSEREKWRGKLDEKVHELNLRNHKYEMLKKKLKLSKNEVKKKKQELDKEIKTSQNTNGLKIAQITNEVVELQQERAEILSELQFSQALLGFMNETKVGKDSD